MAEWFSADTRRKTLINELVGGKVSDLGACFDLKAFPLPVRIGPWIPSASWCSVCRHDALHIYMNILPRGENELEGIVRDASGRLELNTCTAVNQNYLDRFGPEKAIEIIRGKIKDMVMHEVYEAILFRGERIFDPHSSALRPLDQPF